MQSPPEPMCSFSSADCSEESTWAYCSAHRMGFPPFRPTTRSQPAIRPETWAPKVGLGLARLAGSR